MKTRHAWALRSLVVVGAIVCAGSLALLAASFAPFDWVKGRADRLSVDGTADFLTRAFVERVMLRTRVAAILTLVAGIALLLGRGQAAQGLVVLSHAAAGLLRQAIVRLRVFFREEDRLHLAVLGVILLCALGIRAAFLAQPMRYDETYTYLRYAAKPVYIGLSDYSAPNNHVLHTLLVHLSTRLLGGSPWAIRLPALLAGITLVPAAYVLGRAFSGKDAALLAATLVGTSSALVEFSVNARGYTLMALCFLLILALATYLRRSDNPAAWALFAVLSALGFYAVPVMLYPFGVVVTWLGLSAARGDAPVGRRRLLRNLLVAVAGTVGITLVLYAPVLLASGPAALVGNPFIAPQSWGDFLASTWNELRLTWDQWHRDLPAVLALVWLASFLLAVFGHARRDGPRVPVVAAVLLWCVPLVLAQRAVVFRRVWLFLLPWYLSMVAAGLTHAVRWMAARVRRRTWAIAPGNGAAAPPPPDSGGAPALPASEGRPAPPGLGVGGPMARAALPAFLAIAVCLGLGWNVWRMQSVYHSDETEAVRAAPDIARFFQQTLRPGDRVLTVDPASTVLEYYLSMYGVSTEYLVADVQSSRRIFVVVQQSPDRPRPSLDDLLREAGLSASASDVRPVGRYDGALVFELDR